MNYSNLKCGQICPYFCLLFILQSLPADRWYKEGIPLYDANNKWAKCTYDVDMNKVDATERNSLIVSCIKG